MVYFETDFQLDGSKQTWPSVELAQAEPAEAGGTSTEAGAERKLHSAFVWSEKSIKLLSCELHRKEQPRNTHRGSLAISFFFFSLSLFLFTTAGRGVQVVVAFGQSEKGKKEKRRMMFFYCKACWRCTVHLFTIWDWQHKICMLIHMLSLFCHEYLTLQSQWGI